MFCFANGRRPNETEEPYFVESDSFLQSNDTDERYSAFLAWQKLIFEAISSLSIVTFFASLFWSK